MLLNFPKPMRIYTDHQTLVTFPVGVNDVDEKLVRIYGNVFEANGVKPPAEKSTVVVNTQPAKKPGTLEELTAEGVAANHSPEEAVKLAQERIAGIHGEEAKFTAPGFVMPPNFTMPVAQKPDEPKTADENGKGKAKAK